MSTATNLTSFSDPRAFGCVALQIADDGRALVEFHGKLRDELLNSEILYTLKEATVIIERWRHHYNTIRPHNALGYIPPAPETILPRLGFPELRYAPFRPAGRSTAPNSNLNTGPPCGVRPPDIRPEAGEFLKVLIDHFVIGLVLNLNGITDESAPAYAVTLYGEFAAVIDVAETTEALKINEESR